MKSVGLKIALVLSLVAGVAVFVFRSGVDDVEVGGGSVEKGTAARVDVVTPRVVNSKRVRGGGGVDGVYFRGWRGASAEDELLREEWKEQDKELLAKLILELGLSGAQIAELERFFEDRRYWANGSDREGMLMEDKRSLDSVLMDMLDDEQKTRLKLKREKEVAVIAERSLVGRREGLRKAVEMSDAEAEEVEAILKGAVVEHFALMDEIGLQSMKYGDQLRHNALKTVAEVDGENGENGENGKVYVAPTGEAGEKLMSSTVIEDAPYGADLVQATLLKLEGVLGRERTVDYQNFIKNPNGAPRRAGEGGSDRVLEVE